MLIFLALPVELVMRKIIFVLEDCSSRSFTIYNLMLIL